jgi:hypothetical protein
MEREEETKAGRSCIEGVVDLTLKSIFVISTILSSSVRESVKLLKKDS